MHSEVEELRPKLKEILYDCAVEIRATKAALYLYNGAKSFELVTEYGFRGGTRQIADFNDPLVDRCGRGRTPFYVNGVAAEPRFSELLFEASTDRLLVAPLFLRGNLVGLIDMRDKAGKAPFEQSDIPKAQGIAERIAALFANKNVFGQRFITLSESDKDAKTETTPTPAATPTSPEPARPTPPAIPPAAPTPQPSALSPQPSVLSPQPSALPQKPIQRVPSLATLVIEARNAASRISIAPVPESITETEVAAAREVLRSILLIPGAAAATFSAFGHMSGVQEIAARSSVSDDAKNLIQSKLNVWLTKRGEAGGYVRTNVTTPFGTSAPPIGPNDVQKVFTAPLAVGSLRGLYLTVCFSGTPDRVAHELLATLHSYLQLVIEQSLQRGTIATLRARAAEKIVEPDFTKYPALRRHSEAVAKLAESFARFLALSPAEVENARIVALVHDAGMRLLDYERLYRKKDLTQEELGFLREHPSVGAAIVEPILGGEIASAVLCHHERPDGRGYPNDLHGDEIPMLSRLVAICDAYQTIIDPDGYQPPESPQAALATITRAAGEQFDAEMAHRFVEFARNL